MWQRLEICYLLCLQAPVPWSDRQVVSFMRITIVQTSQHVRYVSTSSKLLWMGEFLTKVRLSKVCKISLKQSQQKQKQKTQKEKKKSHQLSVFLLLNVCALVNKNIINVICPHSPAVAALGAPARWTGGSWPWPAPAPVALATRPACGWPPALCRGCSSARQRSAAAPAGLRTRTAQNRQFAG